jgi:hypothetical protein
MDNSETTAMRQWVARWQKAGPELARLRLQELRHTDVAAAIEQLEDSFQSALLNYPVRLSSGLIEQRRRGSEGL